MLISLNWLRELVELKLDPEQLAETLTIAGFEVEEIHDRRALAAGVVVGKVERCDRHPNADKLSVCQVDYGQDDAPATIVCGASNVKADILVPVAPPKTYLPAVDIKIKAAKLRGVKSAGMICSLAEIGLAKQSEGIHIFEDESLSPGQDVRPLLGLDDIVLDLTSTANRADALSLVGVAREVAALTNAALSLPEVPSQEIAQAEGLNVKISEKAACPAYIGTQIDNIKIAPSPDWLKFRLEAAGVRPINNVVDITNYILLTWGQPLHAFDRDRLVQIAGSENLELGARFAQSGETFTTLDDQKRELKAQNLVITANNQPVAIAGVMGGGETEVYDGTTSIVLEAALFDPVAIRRSSRAQGLRTESSARYERGVNQAELEVAARHAIALIQELAGGTPVSQAVADTRAAQGRATRSIELRLARIHHVLGSVQDNGTIRDLNAGEVEQILTALGCKLEPKAGNEIIWTVTVPPYRYRDLEREIDLIEEVARLYSYDRFCNTLPRSSEPGQLPPLQQAQRLLREAFRGIGLTEVMHYSLVKPEAGEIVVSNPLLSEYSALRTELLPGLIDAFAYNLSQGNGALNGFEIGRIFRRNGEEFSETDAIAGIFGGDRTPQGRWQTGGKGEPLTWYEGKGLLESVFERLGVTVEYRPDSEDKRLHPGRTASLWIGGKLLGRFGQLHPQLRRERELPEAVYVFELAFDVLVEAIAPDGVRTFQLYSTYPAVERDLAFFAPLDLPVAELLKTMQQAGKALLDTVELFDQYQGQGVPENQRSLAFSLAYRAGDRTLTDKEVDPVHDRIREALTQRYEVTLRS
ncbi:MAG: phenylalanine--tRNA ligase subunit beta [Jaaginema sp. PMC 1079.18]|nr:phenylalanine--tRNA ligase subunit beta [Jaaginema sp. PMC 1080.18]MEC4853782.1 phenylalanine--tRNA ligase subunit beta [Jaaginema sp. PMC 1079.18]MEC4868756.1 phenylalanine--tRNA ligase subunit beta [Jaaginema sp. PMC 1078.18]